MIMYTRKVRLEFMISSEDMMNKHFVKIINTYKGGKVKSSEEKREKIRKKEL